MVKLVYVCKFCKRMVLEEKELRIHTLSHPSMDFYDFSFLTNREVDKLANVEQGNKKLKKAVEEEEVEEDEEEPEDEEEEDEPEEEPEEMPKRKGYEYVRVRDPEDEEPEEEPRKVKKVKKKGILEKTKEYARKLADKKMEDIVGESDDGEDLLLPE